MRTMTAAVPGSPITQTDRGRHSRPGVDESVVLQRGSPISIRQLRGSDQARSTKIPLTGRHGSSEPLSERPRKRCRWSETLALRGGCHLGCYLAPVARPVQTELRCKSLINLSWREKLNHPTFAGSAQKLASPAPADGARPPRTLPTKGTHPLRNP